MKLSPRTPDICHGKPLKHKFASSFSISVFVLFCFLLELILVLVTIWVPLIFIFTISAAKEALDDISRAKADKKANSRIYHVLDSEGIKVVKTSEQLRVGDMMWVQVTEISFSRIIRDRKTKRFLVICLFSKLPIRTARVTSRLQI